MDARENVQAAGEVLTLFVDESIPSEAPFATVREKAFALLKPETIPAVADYLRNIAFDKTGFEWSYYTTLSLTFKRNLAPVFRARFRRSGGRCAADERRDLPAGSASPREVAAPGQSGLVPDSDDPERPAALSLYRNG